MRGVRACSIGLTASIGVSLLLAACGGSDATATPAPTATKPAPTATAVPAFTATPAPQPTSTPAVRPTGTAVSATAVATSTPVPVPTATRVPPAPTPSGPRPKYGGVMTMRVSGSFANEFDNYTPTGRFSVLLTQNFLNNITTLDSVDGSTLRRDLAEQWTISSDGKSVTYRFPKGIKWHDGTAFTARDVAASLNRARKPAEPAASVHVARLAVLADVQAPDDSTVQVSLSRPSASFMTVASVSNLTVYPSFAKSIADWKTSPIGTGPFKYKSLVKDTSAEFVRSDSYFKKDSFGQALPYLDGVQYIWITDQALSFAAYRTGRITCACGYSSDILPSQREQAAQAVPGTKFGSNWAVNYLAMNVAKAPLNNLKVRQAVHIGLDRRQLLDILRGGSAFYPPTYFVPQELGGKWSLSAKEFQATPGFREPKDQDTAVARQLLKDAGVDPASLNLKVLGTNTQADIGEAIGSVLIGMGFKVTVESKTTADQTASQRRGDFDVTHTGGGNTFDDPADIITSWVATGGGLNYGKVSIPAIDQLLTQQDSETDGAKRRDVLANFQKVMLDQAVFIPIHTFPILYTVQPYVEGFVLNRAFSVGPHHRLEAVWFNK